MTRVIFAKDQHLYFFQEVKKKSKLSNYKLGELVGISGRSYCDWASGKTLPTLSGVKILSSKFDLTFPIIQEEREEHWSGRINGRSAAIARFKKCGPVATKAGSKKGGLVSQKNRRDNLEHYREIGCKVKKIFVFSVRNKRLAEFVGVVLGDGGLTNTQCQITLHKQDDKEYVEYVLQLINELFSYRASVVQRKQNAVAIVISGVNFIEGLKKIGLTVGNKVKNQVDIPAWIKDDYALLKSCIRGLFDTDGGTILHKHRVSGKEYLHFNLCFSNHSKPLLKSFLCALNQAGIKSSINKHCVMIYNAQGVSKFFMLFNPSNKKHLKRYKKYFDNWRCPIVVN